MKHPYPWLTERMVFKGDRWGEAVKGKRAFFSAIGLHEDLYLRKVFYLIALDYRLTHDCCAVPAKWRGQHDVDLMLKDSTLCWILLMPRFSSFLLVKAIKSGYVQLSPGENCT